MAERTVFRVMTAKLGPVSEPEAPSLEALQVKVPVPAPVTEQDLVERFEALLRERSPRIACKVGESVQAGDEVVLSLVAFSDRRIVPFTAQEHLKVFLTPEVLKQSLFASLLGVANGSHGEITTRLPEDHFATTFRGKPAVYAVHVKGCSRVRLMDPPELVALLGHSSLRETMVSLRRDIEGERANLRELQVVAAMLTELVKRTKVSVPQLLVEKEILQRWSDQEGRFLTTAGVTAEDRDAALQGWLQEPAYVEAIRNSVTRAMVIRAVATKNGLAPTPEELKTEGVKMLTEAGAGTVRSIEAKLRADPAVRAQLIHQAGYLHVLQFIRQRVEVIDAAT